jgi:hypothetical protein
MDLRKGASASDSNRLRVLKNAYVTTGWQIARRHGLKHFATLSPGTKGLVAALGKLHTFTEVAVVAHANPLLQNNVCPHESGYDLTDALQGIAFNGYLYVVTQYSNGSYRHHYLDGTSPPRVTDVNCPQTSSIAKAASKIFAVAGDVVRFCATNDPRDWTTTSDAGYLPTGLQIGGTPNALAVGTYRSRLAVFSLDATQTWDVDPDPAVMKISQVIDNLGTRYPLSVVNVGNDVYFLADAGFRSITTQEFTDNLQDVDIGSPIDSFVTDYALTNGLATVPSAVRGIYFQGGGQYIVAHYTRMFVFTYSRTAKVAAWSYYDFGRSIDALAELDGTLYIRSGDDVFSLDGDTHDDAGETFETEVLLPYMNLKTPGALKQMWGIDLVMDGGADVSVLYDPRDPLEETVVLEASDDTTPGETLSVQACGPSFAVRFRTDAAAAWRLDALTLHYETLGVL